MKGYGIYVKNDLLEPKHFKAIGQALWLYLWLLDKMTSISEDGIGKVLHGVPIKFEKIKQDLPMSPSSYTRYIEALEKAGYITALRTPYGHVFAITKAKKIFSSKENHKKAESQKKRITNVTAENHKCDGNKEDNTINNTIESKAPPPTMKKETYVDYETGETVEVKSKSKTPSKDIIELATLFEKLGEKETGVKPDLTKAYFKLLNSMKSHNLSPTDVKSLFNYFFKDPKMSSEKKVSLGLCISGAYITQWKVAQKNKSISQVDASSEIYL